MAAVGRGTDLASVRVVVLRLVFGLVGFRLLLLFFLYIYFFSGFFFFSFGEEEKKKIIIIKDKKAKKKLKKIQKNKNMSIEGILITPEGDTGASRIYCGLLLIYAVQ